MKSSSRAETQNETMKNVTDECCDAATLWRIVSTIASIVMRVPFHLPLCVAVTMFTFQSHFHSKMNEKKPLKNVRKKSSHEVQNAYEMLLISRHREVCAVGRHFNHCVSAKINFWYLFSHRKSFIIWSIDDVTKISMKSREEEKK